jgi:hypothetical protein
MKLSRMVALIMSVFPSLTPDWLLWTCSFDQFFLWYDRALEIKTGTLIQRDKTTIEDIKGNFKWDETLKRWV